MTSEILRRFFMRLGAEDRDAANERAQREPEYWNPYLDSPASSEERSERAALLRRQERRTA